jgi:outer membrane protein OmpA-like peptidoglycan-associated protein
MVVDWVRRAAMPLALAAALLSGRSVLAGDPGTRQMIEALLPAPAQKTRDLVVRRKPADGASAPAPADEEPPSLSLAIEFDLNSPHVRPESGPLLGDLVAAMQSPELRSERFVIEGHTDASGAPALNQRLSQERADEVRLFLIALGVQAPRLRAVGKGATEPANPQDPLAAENRRVRVVTVQ